MRITACFLIGLLEKLGITAKTEIPQSLRSFCQEKLIYYQMFTGNLSCIRWISRFATGFALLPLCLKSSFRLEKKWHFYFIHDKLERRVTQLTPNPQFRGRHSPDNFFWDPAASKHI